MRVPLIGGREWNLRACPKMRGSISPASLAHYDFDNDGTQEIVLGTTEGILFIIKPRMRKPWAMVEGLFTIQAVHAGTVLGVKSAVAVCCLEGHIKVWSVKGAGSLELMLTYRAGPNMMASCVISSANGMACTTLDRRLNVYVPQKSDTPNQCLTTALERAVPHQVFSMVVCEIHEKVILLGMSSGWGAMEIDTGETVTFPMQNSRVPTAVEQRNKHCVICSEDGIVSLYTMTRDQDSFPVNFTVVWEVVLEKAIVLRPVLFHQDAAGQMMMAMVIGWSGEATIIRSDGRTVECSVSEQALSITATQTDLVVVTYNKVLIYPDITMSSSRAFACNPQRFIDQLPLLLKEENRDAVLYSIRCPPTTPPPNGEGGTQENASFSSSPIFGKPMSVQDLRSFLHGE
eukprot:PhF_6_TR19042/c0_g1_i1/m.27980